MPDRPEPPEIARYLIDSLDRQPPEDLRAIASYADSLAAWKTGNEESNPKDENGEPSTVEEQKTPPDSIPSKATIVTKEINGNHYYYWQWRDGEHVKSEYEGPVPDKE
jgi:hypothetical protein